MPSGVYRGNDKPRKPELAEEYPAAFNLTGDAEKAAKILGVTPAAIRMWFSRNGYVIIKQAIKAERAGRLG